MIIHVFHRNFRSVDNLALNEAIKATDGKVVPIFIFDPRQIENNSFKSISSIRFMIEGLVDLRRTIPEIQCFYGKSEELLAKYCKGDIVYHMTDYTPFAKKRHKDWMKAVKKCVQVDDVLLNKELKHIEKKVYSSFLKDARKFDVPEPTSKRGNYVKMTSVKPEMKKLLVQFDGPDEIRVKGENKVIEFKTKQEVSVRGNRASALAILRELPTTQANYVKNRENMNKETSRLSAYIKFGLVSIREVYYGAQKIKKSEDRETFIKQLYWNNFYIAVQNNFNSMVNPLKARPTLKWENDKEWFKAWREGKTGIPIVDASMTQLNKTGYMDNRGRLIVANVLSHWLLIYWRYGEKYFARQLVDYDPIQNNGNWAFTSSVGADYQVRIYNAFAQGKRHDKNAVYIKKWLPQLEDVPPNDIHKWYEVYNQYDLEELGYYKPIIWNPTKRFKEIRKVFQDAPPDIEKNKD